MNIAMQYSFAFAPGHDMSPIARRIEAKASLFDHWPGLLFKAFLVADERDTDLLSEQNLYAPFYLWADAQAMAAFLASPAFAGVSEAFGRPAVGQWLTVAAQWKADVGVARFASREQVEVPLGRAVEEVLEEERAATRVLMQDQGVKAVVVAFEALTWTLVRMVFHARARLAKEGTRQYRMLHLSSPGL